MPTTKLEIPQINQLPRFARSQDKQANRPNHFYSEGKPIFPPKQAQPINQTGRKIKELSISAIF